MTKGAQLSEYLIRPIHYQDNTAIKSVIQNVLQEYELALPGTAYTDDELNDMYTAYTKPGWKYLVVVNKLTHQLVGGAGIGELIGGNSTVCELKRMFLLPQVRNHGFGKILLVRLFEIAMEYGYKSCYLETVHTFEQANQFYQYMGFQRLSHPMGNTGHHVCNIWYLKKL